MKQQHILTLVVTALILVLLAGCNKETDETFMQGSLIEEETASDEPVDDRTVDLTDYSSYLKKIWIMDEEESDNDRSVSLVITKIEEGTIQGYFDDTSYVYTYYFWLPRMEKSIPEFSGTIYDGTAECRCDYKDGKKGTLTITFCEDDRIEAALDGKNAQSCLLRPYHISDVDYLNGETIVFETELSLWGAVTIYAVNPYRRDWSPEVFFLNEQGDILFEFNPYGEILEVIVEDMDEDGLEDVKIIASLTYLLSGDWVTYRYEYPYYQSEDGYFVSGDRVTTEESVEEAKVSFDGFGEMDYALFLETDVGYGVTLDYYKYGIYGDFVNTVREGEEVYFELCKAMLDTDISWKTHEDWADSMEILHIQNLSPDLQWLVAREYLTQATTGHYEDKVIHNGDIIAEVESWTYEAGNLFKLRKTEQGTYELVDNETLKIKKQLVDGIWEWSYIWHLEDAACMDEYGKVLAISEPDNQSIGLYSTEDGSLKHHITMDDIDKDYPIEVSQLVGDKEKGWLVFSQGNKTYRLDYPMGEPEEIGEFMYNTTYSPDGKYLAYCTGNSALYDLWMDWEAGDSRLEKIYRLYDEWDKISPGWYVREVETGNTAYIPIETWLQDDRPLYGGRCVWLEKDKLFQILNH